MFLSVLEHYPDGKTLISRYSERSCHLGFVYFDPIYSCELEIVEISGDKEEVWLERKKYG